MKTPIIAWVSTTASPEAKHIASLELGYVEDKVEFECARTTDDIYVLSVWSPEKMTCIGWYRTKKAANAAAERRLIERGS